MKIICLYILLGIFILPSHGFSALFEKQCTNRYEFRHDVPHIFPYLKNCTYVRHMHPICGKNIVISYAEHAPYVTFNHTTGRPVGFLPGNFVNFLSIIFPHVVHILRIYKRQKNTPHLSSLFYSFQLK